MIFNNIDFSEHFKILDIKKSLLPPIENSLYSIAGKHGAMLKNSVLKPKVIEVKIEFKGKANFEDKIRELGSLLYTKELSKLFLPNSDKYYLAKLDGDTDLDKFLYYGVTKLKFIIPDPLAYGDVINTAFNNSTILLNNGTWETRGIITVEISEPIDYLEVGLKETGESIYLGHDFIVGDIVTIDLIEEVAYKNGYSIMEDCFLESDFFDIPKGEFSITLNSGSGNIEFIERWL
jgi:predicted phage tail component-like protein